MISPLTENELVRILSNPAYHPAAERPAMIAGRLRVFRESGDHVFWPDDLTLSDSHRFELTVGHRQLTDAYLLALALVHGGRLATFDGSIPLKAVRGAGPRHVEVIRA